MRKQELREKIARMIAILRGLNSWEYLPDKQSKECGVACKEACFRSADQILVLVKEAGYRLPVGKAPLLTDKQIRPYLGGLTDSYLPMSRRIAKAQNDADNKYFLGE